MSSSSAFVHLRMHSEYSVVDGIVRIDEAVAKAVADEMPALALTDLSNLFGLVKFYQAARSSGIKPVVGCDAWISNEADRDKPFRILLLCQSYPGYLLLCRLLSRAYRENQHRGRSEIKKSWFSENGTEGLLALSGASGGEIGSMLVQNDSAQAEALAKEWVDLFPGRFYIELQRAGHPNAENLVQRSLALASNLRLPVVATHPIQFLNPEDYRAHEARVCIAEGYVLGDRRRPRHCTEEQYFKTQAEMAELFADIPAALANTLTLAKRCNLTLELGVNRLPAFPTPNNESLEEYLRNQAAAGLEARMKALYPDSAECEAQMPKYRARLEFETNIIIQMGFAGYFLIVADFINWAKNNSVPVGPGRGSGAGSLVAYSLGITDLDPLRYDLLFERFLNPERVSMPDFDIDFCQDGREHVIEYVKQKYGAESVSQIATFGTMAAKAVVRDVGRVLDLPYSLVDQLAKLVPFELGMTLKKAREDEPQLNERAQAEEEVRNLLELAERLEGITRNVGMHAGGVLIAPGKITDFCPIYSPGGESVVSQLDKDDVEKIGLVKFDFLGLRTLTILDWTVRYIRQRKYDVQPESGQSQPATEFSLENLPLDDQGAYGLMRDGNAVGIFQFESRGMKDLLQKAKPDCFEDIIALVALYRPGPMSLIPEFIERKHGKRVEYLDPRLRPILEPTYGVMVYQEQVMQIAQVIGGYSLGKADLLRRAMGKKKPEEMALHRDIFISGAVGNGLTENDAAELFDLMEKFAGYGFNKSHAAAYALIAFQTAYLKAHYPAEFMAATLSADMDDTDKVHGLFEDSLANQLTILPPDVNLSDYRFVPVDSETIRYGLGAIKGTGESAIAVIIESRKGGPFTDLFDFCHRVDKRIVNRRVVESLIRAGAFDAVDPNRASLLASVGVALESAEQADRAVNQVSLFGETETPVKQTVRINVSPWSEKEKLANEKIALGFYLTGHPFKGYEEDVRQFARTSLSNLSPQREIQLIAGIVNAIRIQMTRRGRMSVVVLDDGSARVELVVYSELFESVRAWLKEDQLVVAEVKVFNRGSDGEYGGELRISADQLYTFEEARSRFAKRMELYCNGQANPGRLKELLSPYRNGGRSRANGNQPNGSRPNGMRLNASQYGSPISTCPVRVVYRNGSAGCALDLGDEWRVSLRESLLESLRANFRDENVKIVY